MRQIPFISFALAALVPGLLWSYFTGDLSSLKYAIPIAYFGTVVFAIPLYLLVEKYWRVFLFSSSLGGGMTGLLTWVVTYLVYNAIWNDDLFKAGLSAALVFLAFVCFGAVAGFVFWLMRGWQQA
jgi:hypothetical protein